MGGGCPRTVAKEEQLKKKDFRDISPTRVVLMFGGCLKNHPNLQEIVQQCKEQLTAFQTSLSSFLP